MDAFRDGQDLGLRTMDRSSSRGLMSGLIGHGTRRAICRRRCRGDSILCDSVRADASEARCSSPGACSPHRPDWRACGNCCNLFRPVPCPVHPVTADCPREAHSRAAPPPTPRVICSTSCFREVCAPRWRSCSSSVERYPQIRARQAGAKPGKRRSLQPVLLELAASGVAMEIRV